MDILTFGIIGGATYALIASQPHDGPGVVDKATQWLGDVARDVQQEYADVLHGVASQRSKAPRYARACTVRFIWKWADTRNYSLAEWKSYGQHYIVQSCSAEGRSTVPTSLYQGSGNGVADDHPNWPDMNGGLNPVLALKSLRWLRNGEQTKFESSEEAAARALLASNGLEQKYWLDVIRTIKGVGFFKLSEYHWIATIDWALQLLDRAPGCEQVTVKFQCTSETNKWYQEEWIRRLHLALGQYFQWTTNGADPDIITNYRGESVVVAPIRCGEDLLGQEIWSIPFECGAERTFWREDVEALRIGPCRNLFARLSPVFKQREDPTQNRFILDAADGVPREAP